MKKQYISPETLSIKLRFDSLLNTGSITAVEKENDLQHDIIIGGNAESGGSDSRRRDIWADEDDEDEF